MNAYKLVAAVFVLLSVLLLLAPDGSSVAAPDDPKGPVRLDLSEGDASVVRTYTPSKEAQSVILLLVSDVDVDLYVYDSLESFETDESVFDGDSRHVIEAARIDVTGRKSDEPIRIQALDPNGPTDYTWAVLSITEETKDRKFILPGEDARVVIEPGQKEAVRHLLLIEELEYAVVRAVSAAGRPGLAVSFEEDVFEGKPAGSATEAFLKGGRHLSNGEFKVVVTRPEGASADKALAIGLEASLASEHPTAQRLDAGAPSPLPGQTGEKTLSIDEEDTELFFIDLLQPAKSIDIATEADEGDFDLYVSRGAPALGGDEWDWASWRLGPTENVHVGGAGTLPAGRYWVMIDHHSGEDPEVTLSWKIRTAGVALASEGRLPDGKDAAVEFGSDQCFRWWELPSDCRADVHLQVLYAGKRVELAVARKDTGEILQRTDLSRKTPYLYFSAEDLVADDAPLLIGVYRWTMDEPVSAGKLLLSSKKRPIPGPAYFPPYPTFTDEPRDRMLATTVELIGEDGSGTGVLVSPTGLILSCEHVVEGEEEMIVHVPFGERGRPRELYRSEILHSDAELDLSLLRITGDVFDRPLSKSRPLPFAAIGDSTPLRLADRIFIPGYPTSASSAFESNLVLTIGILAGVEQERDGPRWLISDALVADGNSGSGFFDEKGVVRAIHSMSVGPDGGSLGYGRPLDKLPAAWKQRILREGGRWAKGR